MKKNNISKRFLAMLLALSMIIPVVNFGTSNTDEVQAAKTVSTDMLKVKVQVAADGSDAIRFISSVDSLDYNSVGFEVRSPIWSSYKYSTTTTVFERIVSSVTDKQYEFSPKLVDFSSRYLVTAKLKAVAGVDYTVRAFVTTFDEPTKRVYGPFRTVSLEDGSDDIINMTVDFDASAGATYDVYADQKIGTAKLIDKNGDKTSVRIQLEEGITPDSFKSATKFSFKSNGTEVGTTIYRNFYTSYKGEGTEDTSWYDVDPNATKFVIASSADLYGLAKLVNETDNDFHDDLVVQIRNIEINQGTASAERWIAETGSATYEWDRIGRYANTDLDGVAIEPDHAFKGTYEGDHNIISGIVLRKTDDREASDELKEKYPDLAEAGKLYGPGLQRYGLFGWLGTDGKIANLQIANSYFEFRRSNSAPVVGYCQGDVEGVRVAQDVYVWTSNSHAGGIVGMISLINTKLKSSIKDCCFEGTLTSTNNYAGGIIGRSYRGSVTLENCLFTGTVSGQAANDQSGNNIGGLIGATEGMSASDSGTTANRNKTTIINSISAGKVESNKELHVGSVIGGAHWTKLTMKNVYTTEDIEYTGTGSGFVKDYAAVGIGSIYKEPKDDGTTRLSEVLGVPKQIVKDDFDSYHDTEFDFWSKDNEDGSWVAMEDGTPALKAYTPANATGVNNQPTGKRTSEGWYYNAWTNAELPVEDIYKDSTAGFKHMVLAKSAVFELDSAADLNGFEKICNNTTDYADEKFTSDVVKLMTDIDLNPGWVPRVNESGTLQNQPENRWTPIGINGASATQFDGVFDGKNHSIRGVYVDKTTRDTGLFGITGEMAMLKDVKMSNSYIKDNKGYAAAFVGSFYGKIIENIDVDNSVYVYSGYNVGGIVGARFASYESRIWQCRFDGTVYGYDDTIGGILGNSVGGTGRVENCLFSGKIVSTKSGTNSATVGGLVGWADTNVLLTDCLSMGEITINSPTKYTNSVIGYITANKGTKVTDVYTTDSLTHATDSEAVFNTPTTGSTTTTEAKIKANAKTELKNLFTRSNGDENTAWTVGTDGMAELNKEDDGILKILLIGNSFCFYHTDELYGMLKAAGIEAIVSNVYNSGCSIKGHRTLLFNYDNRPSYTFGTEYMAFDKDDTNAYDRFDRYPYSLNDCLDAEDWDVIALQQHFDPSDAMDLTHANNITLSYAKELYNYLRTKNPKARLLWQQTWAYQVGYTGVSGRYDSDEARRVDNVEKQTLNYEIIRDVAKAVCQQNNVERVPNGDSWQKARAVVGDVLCNKIGKNLAADTKADDNYHDGDKGGGQILNACGWYEVITGKDCRDNTYVPTYKDDLLTNTTLTTPDAVIDALKEAAHAAVTEAKSAN